MLHTPSSEKKQLHSKIFSLHIFFLLLLLKPQYQQGIRREICISFVIILSAFPMGALLCHTYSHPCKARACCSAKFLAILHLTFSGREPLPWPQAMKISRAPKPTSRCVFQLLPGCGKHTQLTAAFMLLGLGASLTKDQHPPRAETSQLLLHTLLEHNTITTHSTCQR